MLELNDTVSPKLARVIRVRVVCLVQTLLVVPVRFLGQVPTSVMFVSVSAKGVFRIHRGAGRNRGRLARVCVRRYGTFGGARAFHTKHHGHPAQPNQARQPVLPALDGALPFLSNGVFAVGIGLFCFV